MIEDIEAKALLFADNAHKGQLRRDKKTPYISHPMRVSDMLKRFGIKDENIIAAAYLHDTIEDTKVTIEDIKREFNPAVAMLVNHLTINKDEDYFERIRSLERDSALIKLADILDNITDMKGIPENKKEKFMDKKLKALEIVIPKVLK